MPIDLDNIPKGAWVRRDGETVIIGAFLRDSLLFNWSFALIWCFSMWITPLGLVAGDWVVMLIGTPFFLAGLYL
jgi:hypothetical protein